MQRREAELKSSEQQQLMRAAGLNDKIKGKYETEKRKQKLMEENELLMKCLGSKRSLNPGKSAVWGSEFLLNLQDAQPNKEAS